jgi:hypothetical protein
LVLVHTALSHALQRRYEDALTWGNRALETAPTHLLAGVFVAFVYWRMGDIDRFVAHTIRTAIARNASDDALESMRNAFADMRRSHAASGFAGWSEFMADQTGDGAKRGQCSICDRCPARHVVRRGRPFGEGFRLSG